MQDIAPSTCDPSQRASWHMQFKPGTKVVEHLDLSGPLVIEDSDGNIMLELGPGETASGMFDSSGNFVPDKP